MCIENASHLKKHVNADCTLKMMISGTPWLKVLVSLRILLMSKSKMRLLLKKKLTRNLGGGMILQEVAVLDSGCTIPVYKWHTNGPPEGTCWESKPNLLNS
jgi:hypothetical protein